MSDGNLTERFVSGEQHEHALQVLTGLSRDQIIAHVIVVLREDGSPSISSDTATPGQAVALLAYGLHAHTASAIMQDGSTP